MHGNWRTCVRAATLTALCLHAPRVNTLSCAGSAAAAASLRPLPRATARLLAMTSGAGTETARLGQLWRGACEVMLNVPAQPQNIDVCLVPTESIAGAPGGSSTTSSSDQLPAVLRQYTVMALTAFDPPGTMRERDANAAANARLWADIMQLPTAPSCAWRSFGFDNDEGWREDGFCLAFDDARMPAARHAVLELARRHDQGAIFEYYYDTRECRLMRRTLGACLEMLDEAEVALTPVDMKLLKNYYKHHHLVSLPWAGPADGGVLPPASQSQEAA